MPAVQIEVRQQYDLKIKNTIMIKTENYVLKSSTTKD